LDRPTLGSTNAWIDMSSFLQDSVNSDAVLADIRSIVEIESPSFALRVELCAGDRVRPA
jgi:hypothetical protein